MSSSTLRILGYVALALSAFAVANGAEAGIVGSDFASFGRFSPVQTVQFGGSNCYYADGWNGRGWYQCGNEWNDGFGWIGPFNLNTFGGSRSGRHPPRRRRFPSRAPNPVYPRLGRGGPPSGRLGAGAAFPALSPRSAPAPRPSPPACRRWRVPRRPGGGELSSRSRRRNSPHRRACLARLCCRRRLAWAWRGHKVRIGAPVSPRLAGVGGFHAGGGVHGLGGATGVHIGSPASPSFAGVGGFHAGGGVHGLGGATRSISARLSRPALLAAAVCTGLAGRQESISARRPPQVLRALGLSMPAAASMDLAAAEGPTSARSPHQVLPAAGFMALEGAELSRVAGRRSDRAASDIAERAGRSLSFSRS